MTAEVLTVKRQTSRIVSHISIVMVVVVYGSLAGFAYLMSELEKLSPDDAKKIAADKAASQNAPQFMEQMCPKMRSFIEMKKIAAAASAAASAALM